MLNRAPDLCADILAGLKEKARDTFLIFQLLYRFLLHFFKFITARIKSSKAGPAKQVSRTTFLQHTRPSELARHTPDDISCIHNPHHNVMHLTKSQQTCLRKSFPTSVSPPASLSHSPLWCGFYFMALDNPNVSLQVPLRGVGWLAHARKHTHTHAHTQARTHM